MHNFQHNTFTSFNRVDEKSTLKVDKSLGKCRNKLFSVLYLLLERGDFICIRKKMSVKQPR